MYLHQVHEEVVVFHFIFDHDLGELTVGFGWNFAGRIGLQLYNTVQILLFFYLWPPLPNTNLNIQPFEAYQERVLQKSLLSFQAVNPDLNLNFVSNFVGLIRDYW